LATVVLLAAARIVSTSLSTVLSVLDDLPWISSSLNEEDSPVSSSWTAV